MNAARPQRDAGAAPHLTFHGAAGMVTGSCYLLTAGGARILVDCGLFQGPATVRALNWRDLPFDPRGIDALLLTHAHTDHAGLIPRLTRAGFQGPVICTEATRDLCAFMLPDSGGIQEADVRSRNKRLEQRGEPPVAPIYTRADAEAALDRFEARPRDAWFDVPGGMRARFWNAGHLLGSASIELAHDSFGTLLFSGDIGPEAKTFQTPAQGPQGVDWLVMETTYGDRNRDDPDPEARRAALAEMVRDALAAGGNLLIPAFAVERTQELLYDLDLLIERNMLPTVPIVIDSPLAREATEAFRNHLDDVAPAERARTPLSGANIRFTTSVEESKALNKVRGGIIIVSASGMAEAGRIRHHLLNNLFRPQATVLFVGHQAAGTLGRLLLDGAREVRIMGQTVAVRARIRTMDQYSGHADRDGLFAWLKARAPVRRGLFLVHGEPEAREAFAALAETVLPAEAIIGPELDSVYALAPGGARPAGAAARIDPRIAARGFDWRNERAALLVELERRLAGLPDDTAREGLLRRIRGTMDDAGSAKGK
jgi:metallo-beta-lactamase family protein